MTAELSTTLPTTSSLGAERLSVLRGEIDNIDQRIVAILGERFAVTREVGVLKRDYDLPPVDPTREDEQRTRLRALAEQAGVDPDFLVLLYGAITGQAVREHIAIRDGSLVITPNLPQEVAI